MKNKINIFFIFQDLSKTGAPIIFNNYLKIAKTHSEFGITIFSRYNNPHPILIDDIRILHNKLPKNIYFTLSFKIYDFFFFIFYILIKRPKVIFTNSYINTIPILVAKIFKIKTLVLVHENSGALIRFKSFRSFLIRKSNNIIAVSNASYQFCISQNISDKKITIIKNGLNLSKFYLRKFDFKSKTIKLGALANWSKYKRLDMVIDFYNQLIARESIYDFKLIIGGDCYSTYKSEFEKIKLSNPHVHFYGLVSVKNEFYTNLNGYLYFSEKESYPTVLMESLFFQIPVFSTSAHLAATEVLQDALIVENNLNELIQKLLNFYTINQEENVNLWHKKCINQLAENNIVNSWDKLEQLIIY
jgi:glycosyltransferase involved in cell wall biosynthesis